MKTVFCGLFLILVSSSAWALEPVSARNACSRLKPESNEDACYKLLTPTAKFYELAVGVCDGMVGSKDTLSCMRQIQYGTFESDAAIRVCDGLKVPSDIIECLGAIEFEHIQDEAVAVCARIENREFALDCMEIITGKTYTSRDIFECERERSEEDIADCFEDKGIPNPNDFQRYASQSTPNCHRPPEEASIQEKLKYLADWSSGKSCSKSTKK